MSGHYGSVNGNPAHPVAIVNQMMTLDGCDELDEPESIRPRTCPTARPNLLYIMA
jgi:hypothetical protein